MPEDLLHTVQVTTTARLHMGFIDLNGGLGRRFGSVGLSLQQPLTCVRVTAQEQLTATGAGSSRALDFARQYAATFALPGAAHIHLIEAIPEHAGLGSGTQLALAVGVALARLYQQNRTAAEIAALSGRGHRSGIGVGAFEQGGFLVDGGRGPNTQVPPILSRMSFPEAWRLLLVFDREAQGIHGEAEIEAFGRLSRFSSAQAAHLCRLLMMQILPALAEHDLPTFGAAIEELQRVVGEHFAPVQGGLYISPRVADAMAWLRARGVQCAGQSSWGPTGFAVVGEAEAAETWAAELQKKQPELDVQVCCARNQGSLIETGQSLNSMPDV